MGAIIAVCMNVRRSARPQRPFTPSSEARHGNRVAAPPQKTGNAKNPGIAGTQVTATHTAASVALATNTPTMA